MYTENLVKGSGSNPGKCRLLLETEKICNLRELSVIAGIANSVRLDETQYVGSDEKGRFMLTLPETLRLELVFPVLRSDSQVT
jgi:hypothetical protein